LNWLIQTPKKTISVPFDGPKTETESEKNIVDKMLYVKEKFNICAYHEMSMISDLPTSYSLSKAAKQHNAKYILQSTPGNTTVINRTTLSTNTLSVEGKSRITK